MRRVRAFSLLELMAVVAIVGIGASLAVPSFRDMAKHYRASETFQSFAVAVTDARSLAQKLNVPVKVTVFADRLEAAPATPTSGAESVRRSVTTFETPRTTTLTGLTFTALKVLDSAGAVTSTVAPGASASFFFCPSSDNYFRDGSGNPICGVGNLASADVKIVATMLGETEHVRVRKAVGAIDLRGGS